MAEVLQILKVGSMLLVAGLLLTACDKLEQETKQGYVASSPLEESIKVGETTKDEVRSRLGTPSTISAFPPETWFYVSRQRETIAFFKPSLINQKVARVEFDPLGVVSKFELLDKSASRDVEYVERKTPTEGRTMGVMEQLLGNLGKFNTPRDATQNRQ